VDQVDGSVILAVVENLNKALRGFDETQREMAEVTGTAWSDDRLVKAVVGPRGQLVELEIDPRAVRRANTEVLSATIVATVRAAAADAMDRTRGIVEQSLPDMRGVFGGSVPGGLDLARMAFGHDADLTRTAREDNS